MHGDLLLGFLSGVVIASLTAPVGVSGAVFLLPVQLSVLAVPNPAVTPTNLMYNVIAGPGALLRYRRSGQFDQHLTGRLLAGTVPGVIAGALIRVYLIPGERPFRIVAGIVLLGLGLWLLKRTLSPPGPRPPITSRRVVALATVVGVVGGVYGIGGGSILSPILVGTGLAVATVAPAALASTFVTSVVGALTFAVLGATTDGHIAPDWPIGIATGLGGLIGGYLGARLQPRLPEQALRVMLGVLAAGVGCLYLQALTG
jgi:uncharacterized membrane protein YfcA